ncbi:MAG TPA: transcriptional repressor LexA [Syntrophales bacterium]|nr:transcriptional repressor LexA [Syntrophales bacterium]
MKEKRTLKDIERRISDYLRKNGRMPTYSEMMELLGVRSKSVVDFWVKKLVAGGILRKDAHGFLIPLRPLSGLPMVGDIRAGFPSPAEEELRDIISLDEFLVGRPDSSFLLKVSGDSMINEGIKQGDLVIVEKGREPKNGDIVIAEVDGEWTLKYFRREGKSVVLEAANPDYPPIRAKTELRIGGVISAVIRKYYL